MKRRDFLSGSVGGSLAMTTASAQSASEKSTSQSRQGKEAGASVDSAGPPIQIGLHAQFPLPKNGRQFARRKDGSWFFTYAAHIGVTGDRGERSAVGRVGRYSSETEIRIRGSYLAAPRDTSDFSPETVLVTLATGYTGRTPRSRGHVIPGRAGTVAATDPSIVVDHRDLLHLAWTSPDTGEVWYARCDVSGDSGIASIQRTENWRHGDGQTVGGEKMADDSAALGDIGLDLEGRPCLVYGNRHGITFARYVDGWRSTIIANGADLKWPTMVCDRAGVLHVVWVDGQRLIYYLRSPDGGARWIGAEGKSNEPDLIGGYCHEPPSLAATRSEVMVAHYQGYRVITYSHHNGKRWKDNTVVPHSYDHNSPMLTVDRHDVIWMHMIDRAHDWSRTGRWLGDGWSDLQEGIHLPEMTGACSAERMTPAGAQDFAVILADKSHRLYFDRIRVPAPKAQASQHVMFLDLWEVSSKDGLEQIVEPMEKDPRNPVLKHGMDGSWDAAQANFEGTVFKDGDRFRMWYTGLDRKPYFPVKTGCGYAESSDGVTWTKPNLGLYEYGGSKNNNICYNYGFAYAVVKMPPHAEPDPNRRYYMAFSTGRGASLAFSPDGLRWTESEDNPLWTKGRPQENDQNIAENSAYIYDPDDPDPERRFKAYPQTDHPVKNRTVALMFSSDGIHFKRYPNNPVLDPAMGAERQNHYIKVCWRRHGVFIGLYGAYLDNVNIDARLAVSRDGVHWIRVKRGQPVLQLGEAGSWDGGMVFPSNYPIIEGENLCVYYSGLEFNFTAGEGHASVGLARARLDGFASMQLRAKRRRGSLTTIPFELGAPAPRNLLVNADRLAPGERTLRVEVLDAGADTVVPGFGAADCVPLVSSGLAIPVTWRGGRSFENVEAKRIRLRFGFEGANGSPRLCSFGFA